MPDDITPGTAGEETTETPTQANAPKLSGNSSKQGSDKGVASPSNDVDALANAVLEKLMPKLGDEIDNRFRSTKDKRFRPLEELGPAVSAFRELGERLKPYLGEGVTDAQLQKAIREASIDELLTSQGRVPGRDAPAGEQRVADKTMDSWLKDLGLTRADQVVIDWSSGSYESEADAKSALGWMAAKSKKQAEAEDAFVPSFDGRVKPPRDQGERIDQINALYAALDPLLNEPTANAAKITQIKARIAKLESSG